MSPREGKIIRNARKLQREMSAVLTEMEENLLEAYRLANGDPKTAELYIQIVQGRVAMLRNQLTTDYERLMRYADVEDPLEEEDLEDRVARLTEENEEMKKRLAALEQRSLTLLQRGRETA